MSFARDNFWYFPIFFSWIALLRLSPFTYSITVSMQGIIQASYNNTTLGCLTWLIVKTNSFFYLSASISRLNDLSSEMFAPLKIFTATSIPLYWDRNTSPYPPSPSFCQLLASVLDMLRFSHSIISKSH